MKIIAISSQHSDEDAIALVTEPLLSSEVFEEFKQRLRDPALQPQLIAGCLSICPERFEPELCTELEELLTEAEEVITGITARKQAELEQSEKELMLASAAAGFGLPIV